MKKKSQKLPNGKLLSAEEFVRAWQGAKDLDDLVAKTKCPRSNLQVRASGYRAKGVPLKKFPTGFSHDWAALAKLAKECGE